MESICFHYEQGYQKIKFCNVWSGPPFFFLHKALSLQKACANLKTILALLKFCDQCSLSCIVSETADNHDNQ